MKKILALVNLIIFSGMIYLNYLGGTGGINDISTGDVSGLYPNLFTPSGITFSIWSIIYLFNLAFVIHQLVKAFRSPDQFNTRLNQGFFAICLINGTWVMAWHHLALGYSLLLMFILLGLLIATYIQAKTKNYSSQYFTEYVNFSIYLGWISVASIANTAIYLTQLGVSNEGNLSAILTLVTILVAVLLGLFFLFRQNNPWYVLVIIWASFGIYLARSVDSTAGASLVKIGAIGAMVILAASLGYRQIVKR